jgi:Double-GTPase 1
VTEPFRLCLIGLPKTGKTTYIAALWAYLRSGLPEDKYRVPHLPDNTEYLNLIANAWAEGLPMPRSSPGMSDHIEFTIEAPEQPPLTIVLPDLPGEVFLNAIRRPLIEEGPEKAVTESDLLLVFVNCEAATMFEPLGDHPVDEPDDSEDEPPANDGTATSELAGHEITNLPDGLNDEDGTADGENVSEGETVDDDGAAQVDNFKEFAPGDLDTDTLNTELLQRIEYLLDVRGLPPIAIVVSAWDVHAEEILQPESWLRDHQPMFWQHLEELRRTTTIGVVGVSAQGANYSDHPDVVEKSMSDRAWGRDEAGEPTDIVGPLLWFHSLPQPASDG